MNLSRTIALIVFSSLFGLASTTSSTLQLYKVSGLKEQIRLLSPTIQYQINQAKSQDAALKDLPDVFMQKIATLIENAFHADRLEKILLHHIDKRMSRREINEVLSWYTTPLGKKCVRLENRASTIDGMGGLLPFIQSYQTNPPSRARIQLLQEFSKAIRFYEYTKTLAVDTGVTMLMAFTSAMPPQQRPTIFQVRKQITAQLEQNQQQFETQTFLTLAYVYEDLSDDEMKSYIKFAKSAAGNAFMKASLEALSSAISEGNKRI